MFLARAAREDRVVASPQPNLTCLLSPYAPTMTTSQQRLLLYYEYRNVRRLLRISPGLI